MSTTPSPASIEELGMDEEAILAFGSELVRIGTALRLHRSLTGGALHRPLDQTILLLSAIDLFRPKSKKTTADIDYSWNPISVHKVLRSPTDIHDRFNYTITIDDPTGIPF